jgi:hypothetical protein
MSTDFSEENSAFNFRVEEQAKQKTNMKAIFHVYVFHFLEIISTKLEVSTLPRDVFLYA